MQKQDKAIEEVSKPPSTSLRRREAMHIRPIFITKDIQQFSEYCHRIQHWMSNEAPVVWGLYLGIILTGKINS